MHHNRHMAFWAGLFIGILICSHGTSAELSTEHRDELIKKLNEDDRRKDARIAFKAIAIKVKDGDSIVISDGVAGKEEELRLFGVDTPEKDQEFGPEAREFSAKQVLDKKITVVPFYKDKLKRTIAVVVCEDGEPLENKLVRDGYAWWYDRYDPKNVQLESLQKEAQSSKKGLWAADKPVKPEDHRKRQFDSGKWKVINDVLHMSKDGKLVPEDEY
jgi:micrococcal nuclease